MALKKLKRRGKERKREEKRGKERKREEKTKRLREEGRGRGVFLKHECS